MSFLREALSNQMSEEGTGLTNELTQPYGGHRQKRPDYESEPPPVTLGEDGNYYANDNRWTPGYGWSTIVMDEPVYWVPGGVERSKVDQDHWEYDEYGNVVTKDADFAANDKAINPEGQWMNEEQIRQRWDSDFGMKNFKKANPDMTVDDFLGMARETTALQAQGIDRFGEGGISPEYAEVYAKYGVKTQYEGKDGALYEFNGGGYTLTRDPVDKVSNAMTGIALGIITAGVGAALAPAIGAAFPGMSAAGTKAASSAILNMAQQAMLTGSVDFKDALISAAASYGGAKLSDWVQESGFVDDMVGRSERLQEAVNRLESAGWTPDQINTYFEENGFNDPSKLNDLLDLPVGEILDAVTGGDRSDDVEYGDTESDITGTGPDFNDDFGVDVDITPPEFPEPPTDDSTSGGGGAPDSGGAEGGSTDGAPADPSAGDPNDTTQGQYEVVDVLPDGTAVVRDNRDGDVWYIPGGGYGVGDYIPESDMGNAVGGEGDLNSGDTNPDADGESDGEADEPGLTLPGYLPPLPDFTPDPSGDASGDDTAPPSTTPPGDSGGSQDASGDSTGGGDAGEGDGDSGDGDEGGDADGDNGEGESGNNGNGDGNNGTGQGDGGNGNGNGNGGSGEGQMAGGGGGMFDPEWTPLFDYSPFEVYKPSGNNVGKGLEPVQGLLRSLA